MKEARHKWLYFYDSIHITLWRRQNHRAQSLISGYQGPWVEGRSWQERSTGELWGMIKYSILIVGVITWLSVFFKTHRIVHLKRLKTERFSHSVVSDSADPWTIAGQDPLSMEFPRQEHWSELPFPSPVDLPKPGIEPMAPKSQADSLPLSHQGSPSRMVILSKRFSINFDISFRRIITYGSDSLRKCIS